MSNLNLKNLKENSKEILKAETGTLLFNLGKTHIGFWERKNGNIHFDIDEDEFIDIYGYKLFSEYGDYYKETKGIFNARSPFEIDMDSINDELKDFFNKTEIKLKFKNKNNEIEENLTLTDIVKGNVSDKGLIKNVMFRGCENINSGIDKGAPKKQLDNLHIVNAFGTTKEEITNKKKRYTNKKYYDETRIDFFINLWRKLGSLGKINIDVYKMRKFIINQVENWYIHLLSDSRFPANDVTLWDQAYMTASMFKASIAALCLDGEKHEQYMEYPRTIRWSILGIQYDKLGLAEKALNPSFIYWYRNKAEEVDEKIKEVVEEEYALGNEIYRDETGIYFIVPENICGKKLGDDVGLYRLDKKLDDLQEKVLECFNLFDGEAFPSIFVTEPSRGTMNMAFLIENAKENFLKPVYPKSNFIKEYFGNMAQDKKFKVICDICRMRLANKDEDDDLNLCKVCAKRQRENERTKINDDYKETIWTGELQDKNERIALVTMKFELGEWLNGNMLNTILNSNTEYVSDNIWEEALEEIEDLLKDINKTYTPFNKQGENNNIKESLSKYRGFGNNSFKKGDKFFLYFANIIKSMHKKVYNGVFYGKEFNLKDKNLIDVFNDYFYSFLENESIDLYEIKTDEEIRYNFKAFIDKCEIANDYWTNSPHTVAKGIFSFAYITEQIKSILLERSIGDKWEKFLKDNLGEEKIDFQNREIEWDKLNDEDIKFLSRILLQFVTRKNPSPARFRRIWESTKEFLMNVENDMMDILKLKEGRNIRIKWESIIHEEKHKGKDFEYKGLHFKSDKHGNLYLLSSTEKAVSILSKYKDKEKAYNHILKENTGWLKDKIIEITNLNDNSKCKIELNNPRNIPYKPYLSIINPTPISWQFIVPAEYVTDIIKETQKRYNKEYKYVMGKLPLHIGVVFQDYKKPLYIGIKALRNIRRDVDDWDSLKSNITGKQLQKVFEKNIDDDRLNYYSIYPLNEDNGCIKDKKHIKEFYSIYIKAEDVLYKFKSVNNVKKGEEYIVYHNTIDFEYLDVNTRRNDIYYDITNSKRAKSIVKYKQNRPYTWEEWKSFDKFEEYFNNNKIRIKLQTIINLIYSKLEDWQGCQNDTLNRFMLSAFVNTFELKDVTSKNDFAKMLGNDSWSELENLCNQKFIKELYMFIDMYEFWHNGLKKI